MHHVQLLILGAIAAAGAGCAPESSEAPAAAPQAAQQAALPSRAETEAYIRRSAEEWANVAVTGDPSPLRRILADDYVGVASDGHVRDKARQLQRPPPGPSPFTSSTVDYVNVRHFGPTVIAQGAETLKPRSGGPDVHPVWTDVWMFRDGRWQVVASQDSARPAQP